jgi:hypothetical protein
MSHGEYNVWCQRHFSMMAEEGIWAVPRSGLVFTKRKGALVLTDVMPYDPAMPMNEDELREYQDEDFNVIKSHFEASGIPVRKGKENG